MDQDQITVTMKSKKERFRYGVTARAFGISLFDYCFIAALPHFAGQRVFTHFPVEFT